MKKQVSYLRLVHSQPVEECQVSVVYRPVTWFFVAAVLMTIAVDGMALWGCAYLYQTIGGRNEASR